MLTEILNVVRRSRSTLAQDMVGAVALVIMLLGSLYLPALT